MINITHKQITLRQAVAVAEVHASTMDTIIAVQEKRVPKGDVIEFARAAGLLAIKKTSDVVPDCHPLPVEFSSISSSIDGLCIRIRVEVHTIYKTGVEVEAMHGAMITALTMYDMLKPLDKALEIKSVKLESKKGGKSGQAPAPAALKTAVVIIHGVYQGESGRILSERLTHFGMAPDAVVAVPSDVDIIRDTVINLNESGFDLVLFTGGAGPSLLDVTPEAIRPLLDREMPGVMETVRHYNYQRTPLAIASRGIAGFMGATMVITLPGSPVEAAAAFDALFPALFHVFSIRDGQPH